MKAIWIVWGAYSVIKYLLFEVWRMKRLLPFFTAVIVLGAGCATLPGPVNDEFLTEKTSEEAKKIEKHELAVVEKKKARDEAERDLSVSDQRLKVVQAELAAFKADREVLGEKKRLLTLLGNAGEVEKTERAIIEREMSIRKKDQEIKCFNLLRDHRKSLFELKEAELSVAVAALDMGKARIALKFQEKRPAQFKKETSFWKKIISSSELVDIAAYEKHNSEQRKILNEKKSFAEQASSALRDCEQYTGGTVP